MIFVAYLSALCRNPLHTATQYALLTALAAVGRTYLSAGAGYRRGSDRLGVVFRDLRARRHSEPRCCWLAAGARAFRRRLGEADAHNGDALERRALPDRRRQRALVEIIELAADRHAVREPRHLHVRRRAAGR